MEVKFVMSDLVSIIIVNWNGKKYLKPLLTSLAAQDYKLIEILVVDNASSDGSVTYLKKNFPKIKIVQNTSNLGFAQANSIGFQQAKGKYVLFLNNDTTVTKNFLSQAIKTLKSSPQIGGVQSKILLMDQPKYLDSIGAFFTNTGFLYHYGVNKLNAAKYGHAIRIFSAKGACMLFRKKVLNQVLVDGELFDSRYFAYFEETDLCHRVWLAGYLIVFSPNSIIYHKTGGTSSHMANTFIQFHSFKNRINSYLKNLSFRQLLVTLPIHLCLCQLFALVNLLTGKLPMFFTIQKAIAWNIANWPTTWKKRQYIQTKVRRLSDAQIMPFISKKVRWNYYYYIFTGLTQYTDQEIMV